MKKALSFFDVIRLIISFIIFVVIYLIVEDYLFPQLQAEEITLGYLAKKYFLIEGLGSLAALFTGLLVVSKRYRVVSGTLIMFFSLIFYIFAVVFTSMQSLLSFATSIVGLSFLAVGTSSAILFWMLIDSKFQSKKIQKPSQNTTKNTTSPKTSKILMFLALISVPATYATIFISAFITLGISLWFLAIVLQLPRIPIFILVALGLAPLVSLWAAFRAIKVIFFSPPQFQTAVNVSLADKPKLKQTIEEVCRKVGTKIPDNLILHADATFFVTEGKLRTIDGVTQNRTLAIGAPLLKHLSLNEFKTILAHEFAHFSGNDTAYSRFVVPIYKSLGSAINDIAGVNANTGEGNNVTNLMTLLLLIPMMFLKIFLTYFATIDNILSRSRELRADWIAASNFGSNNMSSGLTKVVQISHHYSASFQNIGFNNSNYFEEYETLLAQDSAKLDEYKQTALLETEQEFDSHPSLSTRINNLPDNIYEENSAEMMVTIHQELNADESRLSNSYQTLIKNYTENEERNAQAQKEFDSLNGSQVSLVQSISLSLKKELKLTDENIQWTNAYLITAGNPPDEHIKKINKIIEAIKKDQKTLNILLCSVSLRLYFLNKYGLKDNIELIKKRYTKIGINLDSISQENLPSLEDFATRVKVFTDEQLTV